MAIDIKVPSVGESITEGTIARWLKEDGASVHRDEPLFELETEKATTEVPAPADGTLHIKVGEGQTVAVGAVVGTIDDKTTPSKKKKTPAEKEPKKPTHLAAELAPREPAQSEKQKPPEKEAKAQPEDRGEKAATEEIREAPERKDAEITPAPDQKPAPAEAAGERETRQPMSAIRARIAERLVAAQQTTASLTTFNEADLSAIVNLRTRYKETFQKQFGVSLGFMGFFVKATIEALKAFPLVNARIDGNDIVQHQYYNIGVAVSTDKGLMVPVLRDADRLSLAAIEKALGELADKARAGKISVGDLQGGTFTITNGGVFGSMLSTPILNAPQSGILGMHAIQKRPVVRDEQIVIRPMMYLALTYDHRLIDGRDAVQFLVRVKECVEDPMRMLLEM